MLNQKNKILYFLILVFFISFSNTSVFTQQISGSRVKPVEIKNHRSLKDLIKLITYRQIQEHELEDGEYARGDWEVVRKSKPPKTVYWSYPTGVTLLAMQRVYEIFGDEKILKFVSENNRISADQYAYLRWQKYTFGTIYKTAGFGKLWRFNMLDDCGAMGAAILETTLRHNVKYTTNLNELIDIIGNYVTNVQYRLDDGSFWRPQSPNGPTIWADDLYMGLPFLIRWSEYTNDSGHLDDAARQIINYASYLQDENGLWFHGYYIEEKRTNCCKWGRGNGWVAVAEAEVLSAMPENHPHFNRVLDIFKKHIEGIKKVQAESGLWHQVLDHPELSWGEETSCSAQFTYAIARAVNRGWIDKSNLAIAQKALEGLNSRISENGGINRVCKSTIISDNLDYYNSRPSNSDDEHGSGLILLALTELYKAVQNN